ncbi:MAG TPA: glycosyltransferase 87 family protein [Thermomicrobiales bacterium]|nr:glycosyltransferase 87 family protein [Thermomicrobiales bacterium]
MPWGQLSDGRGRRLALALPVLFNLGLLFGRPYLSTDLFTYLAHGKLSLLDAGNPYVHQPTEVKQLPFGLDLLEYSGRSVAAVLAPYGPLWIHIVTAVVRLTEDIAMAVLLLKTVVVAASLGTAALIWNLRRRVRPADQLLGTLIYLWNPVVIIEFAGEGHNDALMIFFVVAALTFTVLARPMPGVVGIALGAMLKYVPLIFLPAQLKYVWRTQTNRLRAAIQVALGGLAGLALAVLLFQPYWIGLDTLQGLRDQGETHTNPSTSGVTLWFLKRMLSEDAAALVTRGLLSLSFAVFVSVMSWRVRNTESFLRASGFIALAYVLVAIPTYWPWYVSLPIALMALTPHGVFRWMIILVSKFSRLTAPIEAMSVNDMLAWPTNVAMQSTAVLLPLIVFLLLVARQWTDRRHLRTATTGA